MTITDVETMILLLLPTVGERFEFVSLKAHVSIPILLVHGVRAVAQAQRVMFACVVEVIDVVEFPANAHPKVRSKSFSAHPADKSKLPA
ncbi:MAG: hypothetical protein GY827_03315 [Cytophagales bacterium]|nr:hypothetical protein [Cytophagales bacterium]